VIAHRKLSRILRLKRCRIRASGALVELQIQRCVQLLSRFHFLAELSRVLCYELGHELGCEFCLNRFRFATMSKYLALSGSGHERGSTHRIR
jgi:hypothetical protein